jgi:hypothetical protein
MVILDQIFTYVNNTFRYTNCTLLYVLHLVMSFLPLLFVLFLIPKGLNVQTGFGQCHLISHYF